jgi:hypothetical protein
MSADSKTSQARPAGEAAGATQAGGSTAPVTSATDAATAAAAAAAAAKAKHAVIRYATLRIVIFMVSLGVLWGVVAATGHLVTGNGLLYLMMGAILVSGVASFFLLNKQRDAMSARVTARADRMTRRIAVNSAMEDED